MPEQNVKGRYTAIRDGITYDYDASWFLDSGQLIWRARVRHQGALVGVRNGRVFQGFDSKPENSIRNLVERSIEDSG